MTQPPFPSRRSEQPKSSTAISDADRKRSPWRRRLVEAERGLTEGFRADSIVFGHLFIATIVIMAAFVLGISHLEWGLLILSFAVVLSAEFFHLAIRSMIRTFEPLCGDSLQPAHRIATAGVFITITGSLAIGLLIFTPRLWHLFAGS